MKLSQTGRQFRENVTWGFIPVEVNPSSETELLGVLRCDWSPFLFKGNTRIGENFVSCDCLLMDIDNTDGEKCSIDSFETIFRDTQYIISTSRNHQKTKMYGPGKTLESQPQDRFHVLFPLSAVFTDATLLTASLHALIKKYPFFDKAVSGPAQLVFANPHTILKINSGKEIDIPPVEFTVKIVNKQSFNEWESSINEHDFLKNKTNRVKLLRALQNTASEGGFDNRTDWIRCGMALKKEGFTAQDFASISWDEAMDDAMAQFESFNPERVTAGTLIYFAKQSTKLSFLSEEQEQLIEEGNQILQGWKKNAQEEKAKLLAERKPQAVAGPAPDNFMPPDGLIKEVSEYILSTSIRPLRGLAIASAVSLISVLIGRKYETPTGLGSNIYFVGLAESGSGKEHARKIIKNIIYKAGVEKLLGGETIASGPGLRAALEESPAKLFLLDEFGLLLQGLNSKNVGTYQKDIISTLMKLYSSYGTVSTGTEYSDKKLRNRVDIASPCCCLYATSTHATFYDALSGGDAASGSIARMLVINESDKRPARRKTTFIPIPDSIVEQVKILSEYKPDGGNLASFFPYTVPIKPEVDNAFFDLDESMSPLMISPSTCSVYSRVAENAIKLSLVYAVAHNYRNPIIDEYAFAWGRNISLWCANTLIEQFNSFVSDNEHGKLIKKFARIIKSAGVDGITGRDLLRKVQEVQARERDEIIKKLIDMDEVFISEIEIDGLIKRTQTRFIHADFYMKEKEK
jgi:hypothetical protein